MAQKTFKRYELKYMLDQQQFDKTTDTIYEYMNLDAFCKKNGTYMIYNVYFDTYDDEIIKKSLSKPFYKEKLRLRSYRIPSGDDDMIFLELKKKINGIVNKRRATISYGESKRLLEKGILPEAQSYTDNQVINEISDFLKRYEAHPKLFLSYERTAYHGKEDSEFRVTFDKNILTRRDRPGFEYGDFGTELLDEGKYLMEVKVNGAMPLWFARKLSELKVYCTGFSKYGEEYKKYCAGEKLKEISQSQQKAFDKVLQQQYFKTA